MATRDAESVAVRCHCCGVGIVGCSGSLSWPDGRPFEGPPQFHCPRCTERLLALGGPCHAQPDGEVRP